MSVHRQEGESLRAYVDRLTHGPQGRDGAAVARPARLCPVGRHVLWPRINRLRPPTSGEFAGMLILVIGFRDSERSLLQGLGRLRCSLGTGYV